MAAQEQARSSRVLRVLAFIGAVTALILVLVAYFRVQEITQTNQTYIADGGVSLQSFDADVQERLGDAITYYELQGGAADTTDWQQVSLGGLDDGDTTSNQGSINQNIQGPRGAEGSAGVQGQQGNRGARGAQGLQGSKGVAGVQGGEGQQGLRGQRGESGGLTTVLGNGLSGDANDQTLNISLITKSDGGVSVGSNGIALAASCSEQQLLRYANGSWVCADDANADTTYTAGAGLILDGTSFALQAPACAADEKLLWSGTAFVCAEDVDTISENKTLVWEGATRTLGVDPGNSLVLSDNDTLYTAGQGLSLSGSNAFSLNLDGVETISSPSNQDQILVDTGEGLRKVSYNDLFADLLGAMSYRGTWNADADIPDLTEYCTESTRGHYFVVSHAGATELNGIASWGENDWVVCSGSEWQRIVNSIPVNSVLGRTGAITAQTGDYSADQITFNPASGITATNLEDALQQAKDSGVSSELPSGAVLIGDASDMARAVSLSGDATLSNTGVITIASGAITTDNLAPGAVDGSVIADGSITSSKIADGAVSFVKWGSNSCIAGQIPKYNGSAWVCATDEDNSVTYLAGDGVAISETRVVAATLGTTIDSSEIVAGAVTADHISDSAVRSQHIVNGSVEFDHWASNDCIEGQIPVFDGSGWVCGSSSWSGIGESAGRGSPLASAMENTEITIGELTFRYNRNSANGDLEVRSASESQVALRASREGRYPSAGPNVRPVQSINAQPNTGSFTEIYAGGANPNELLLYEIWTENQIYLVQIGNFQSQRIQMWVWAS